MPFIRRAGKFCHALSVIVFPHRSHRNRGGGAEGPRAGTILPILTSRETQSRKSAEVDRLEASTDPNQRGSITPMGRLCPIGDGFNVVLSSQMRVSHYYRHDLFQAKCLSLQKQCKPETGVKSIASLGLRFEKNSSLSPGDDRKCEDSSTKI